MVLPFLSVDIDALKRGTVHIEPLQSTRVLDRYMKLLGLSEKVPDEELQALFTNEDNRKEYYDLLKLEYDLLIAQDIKNVDPKAKRKFFAEYKKEKVLKIDTDKLFWLLSKEYVDVEVDKENPDAVRLMKQRRTTQRLAESRAARSLAESLTHNAKVRHANSPLQFPLFPSPRDRYM